MNSTKSTDTACVRELVDMAINELLTMPKDEFRALIADNRLDIEALANEARAIATRAVTMEGKRKLQCARASLTVHRKPTQLPATLQDPSRAREYVRRIASSSALMREKLTLAARSGTALSDRDVQSILEDLASLGDLPEID